MSKLSDTQLVILTAACRRTNRLALPLPEHLRGGAAQKVVGTLLAKGLLAEVAAGRGDLVWREADDGRGVTLVATDPAFEALGIEATSDPTVALTGPSAPGESQARRGPAAASECSAALRGRTLGLLGASSSRC